MDLDVAKISIIFLTIHLAETLNSVVLNHRVASSNPAKIGDLSP